MYLDPNISPAVLVVDDNPQVCKLLRILLSREGYQIRVAEDGRAALAEVKQQLPDLILLDLDLPYIDGYEICRRLKQDPATQFIPIVILTGQTGFENKLHAWEYGADEFLSKPFHAAEVLTRCRSLLRIKRLIEERDSAEAVVFALARTVEAKSPYTHGHSERVMSYAMLLADALGIGPDERDVLHKGSLLHDIGKISVPDAILNKPGELDPEEMEVIREHPVQGVRIAEPLVAMRASLPLIRWHHERMDGRGYPDGLPAGDLSSLVRILSVADVFDALASERPYRKGLSVPRCLEIMDRDAANGGLDPAYVQVFRALMGTGNALVVA